MEYLIYAVSYLTSAAGLIIAFWYVLRTGRVVIGFFLCWGLTIFCAFLASVVLPSIVALFSTDYVRLFPDAIAVGATIFFGWAGAFATAALAGFIRILVKGRLRPARPAASRGEQQDEPRPDFTDPVSRELK